ncbi:early transcribed membrane protein, putative [Plasmodium knowlesi strain H]|uniref:Early transcribed membrane protein, putative n=3 Tax=Plasmodium knowlesi TaxID=5850 RepID=A0A5K1UXF5_PLAKH|nr:early transcribed membrane protein [Plasmodium knowlesi strain H]OTN66592.1 putative Early transcribed membrane protein [Plasmodium knowlesi]CAA9986824.1 early transcribed membrane protein [Plasmodium knowlesi strain H]SBO23672.1 early transcribed membrane protein, putative [Plasmodium knowlesi strain H]SBO25248.1 early transcribed membrane protein, putative [Plasmodium knowlesi strain H]VVS76298.1 early transcribed membrane protein [Plasmodium knowlesi strain H]|eukprot:XP_002258008.1 early transcribed membrane protein, putative [Plasmodium knowlesi strain H]
MKITKVLYLIAALLAVNFIAPSFYNNVVEGKKVSGGYKKLTPAERKKRNQKIMMISSIASGIAVLLGTALGLGMHYKNNRGNKGTPAQRRNEPLLGNLNQQRQPTTTRTQ